MLSDFNNLLSFPEKQKGKNKIWIALISVWASFHGLPAFLSLPTLFLFVSLSCSTGRHKYTHAYIAHHFVYSFTLCFVSMHLFLLSITHCRLQARLYLKISSRPSETDLKSESVEENVKHIPKSIRKQLTVFFFLWDSCSLSLAPNNTFRQL